MKKLLPLFVLILASCAATRHENPIQPATPGETKVGSPREDNEQKRVASESPEPVVLVSYSFTRDHVTLHEPVLLQFKIQNELQRQIMVDLGADRKEVFAFSVEKPDGTKIDMPSKVPEGSHGIGRISLQPAEVFTQRLILNEWLDFSLIGKYEITVRLTKPHISPRGLDIYALSDVPEFRSTVYVQPRDPDQLKRLCADLEGTITNAGAQDDSRGAAEDLSYITDPVAVPYLEEVLKTRPILAGFAIAGLERIGNDDAIRALTEASKSKDRYFTAILAKQALDRIATGRKRQDLN